MADVKLLYRDRDIAVAVKPVGLHSERGEGGFPAVLAASLGLPEEAVFPVHRLDAVTGGAMVWALNAAAAARLSRAVQDGNLRKTYLAVAEGRPEGEAGEWSDLLFWDRRSQKAYVVSRARKGAKAAEAAFRVEAEAEGLTLLTLRPRTGRTHQLRVQCASRGLPLYGDRRYGAKQGRSAALWAAGLAFAHPLTGESLCFRSEPPWAELPWSLFSGAVRLD